MLAWSAAKVAVVFYQLAVIVVHDRDIIGDDNPPFRAEVSEEHGRLDRIVASASDTVDARLQAHALDARQHSEATIAIVEDLPIVWRVGEDKRRIALAR